VAATSLPSRTYPSPIGVLLALAALTLLRLPVQSYRCPLETGPAGGGTVLPAPSEWGVRDAPGTEDRWGGRRGWVGTG
jgi:hypothetical protein